MSAQDMVINAPGVDTAAIVEDIRRRVSEKIETGAYDDAVIARAERANLANLTDDDQFFTFYLRCLRDAVFVDISDFTIRERRRHLSGLLIALKKTLWKLLKFYTYRLWSQQNQVNGLIVTAVEGLDEKYSERIEELERRIAKLESTRNGEGKAE